MNNLDNLSLQELRDLKNRVERAIAGFEEKRRREAVTAAEEAARKYGFSLSDLTNAGTRGRKTGHKAAAKYAHPENSDLTWSGRGRRPRWIQEMLDTGKSLEDLLV